jgi:hypothetical protein
VVGGDATSSSLNVYGIAAVAGFVGLFSRHATDKLREVFATLFKTDGPEEEVDPRWLPRGCVLRRPARWYSRPCAHSEPTSMCVAWRASTMSTAIGSPQWQPCFLLAGGHRFIPSALRAVRPGHHPLAGGRLRRPLALGAAGTQHVGVVQQPIDGGGGQRLGHQLVEPGGVDVAGRDAAFLVGGIDDPEERLGGVRCHREQADVVDDDQVGADQLADRLAGAVVSTVAAQQRGERLEGVPGDGLAVVDGQVAERFDEVALALPDGPARQRFSARAIHSRVRSACWVGLGIALAFSSQASNVLPAGRADGPGGALADAGWRTHLAPHADHLHANNHMRPVVPRNHPHTGPVPVFYTTGRYRSFTTFKTDIALVTRPQPLASGTRLEVLAAVLAGCHCSVHPRDLSLAQLGDQAHGGVSGLVPPSLGVAKTPRMRALPAASLVRVPTAPKAVWRKGLHLITGPRPLAGEIARTSGQHSKSSFDRWYGPREGALVPRRAGARSAAVRPGPGHQTAMLRLAASRVAYART